MRNQLPTLIDALCEVFEESLPAGRFAEANGVTHCNEAVNFVAKRMGYDGFDEVKTVDPDDAKRANDMFVFMATSPDFWMEVEGAVAQSHANNGAFVIAAWKNPMGEHGHVAVVRPGNLAYSGKWGNEAPALPRVPKIVNVGKAAQRYIGRGANWSFGTEPKYFALKATIE